MIFFYPGSLMQEHLADRAKVEERLIWFLKRIEGINTLDELSAVQANTVASLFVW